MYEHIEKGLEAAGGEIEFVHFGDDLGTQEGILMSPKTFRDIYGRPYGAMMDLAHRHGARTMMHVCGSVVGMIPTLIDLGLDVLDVVQTNAVGMELAGLKQQFGRDLSFAGTMCVQKVIPFGTPAQVRAEVEKRIELFSEGGLIIGPSHTLHVDSPLENILEMYRAAGGLH
jgi:uroporphyrinogen decarboxylase